MLPVGFTRISSLFTVRMTGASEGVFGLEDSEDAADGVVLLGRDAKLKEVNYDFRYSLFARQ